MRGGGAARCPSGLVNCFWGWHQWLIAVHAVMLPCCFHWKGLQCMISHLTNGQLSFPVVYVILCAPEEKGKDRKWWEEKQVRKSEEMSAREGKRLIHTAGTVVASPASLTLAAVWSDASTVDTLLGAAGCWWKTNFIADPALWGIVNWKNSECNGWHTARWSGCTA